MFDYSIHQGSVLRKCIRRLQIVLYFVIYAMISLAQPPKYTPKHFVAALDTNEFKNIKIPKQGITRTYIVSKIEIWDLDDYHTTFVNGAIIGLLCFEDHMLNMKKEGVTSVYLIDSLNHSRRYKIWDQTYSNNQLNGKWYTYTLEGTLLSFQTYKNDSLNDLTRYFWIDGVKI